MLVAELIILQGYRSEDFVTLKTTQDVCCVVVLLFFPFKHPPFPLFSPTLITACSFFICNFVFIKTLPSFCMQRCLSNSWAKFVSIKKIFSDVFFFLIFCSAVLDFYSFLKKQEESLEGSTWRDLCILCAGQQVVIQYAVFCDKCLFFLSDIKKY